MTSMDFINMKDMLKYCVKCGNRVNVTDSHNECYRNRVCNASFLVMCTKTWMMKNVRSLIVGMIKIKKRPLSFL